MSITKSVPSQEHRLIESIKERCGIASSRYTMTIGDDCAVREEVGKATLLSTDTMVENVHFRLDLMSFEEVGFKAISSSVSDIYAMGGTAESVLIQLVFPKSDHTEADILSLYDGVKRAVSLFGCAVTGGDLASGPCWMIAVTVLGDAGSRTLYRHDAKIGDSIWVTGTPGLSGLGLDLLLSQGRTEAEQIDSGAVKAHISPIPQYQLIEYIQESPEINAMIDISDGVAKEVLTICHESGCSAELHLPDSIKERLQIDQADRSPKELFLSGGEDYELLFTVSDDFIPQFDGVKFTKIGTITDSGTPTFFDGQEATPLAGGWDHL